MRAVIMAGGLGTRLKSVTGDLPKPMAPLCGKPILEHILGLLKNCGVSSACLSLCYRPELIMDYFGNGKKFGIALEYHIEKTPLGTAGGVKACRDFYGGSDFLVVSGDCICDFDLRQLMEAHRRHKSAVTLALYPNSQPLRYGVVLTDPTGRVLSFSEKPAWQQVVSDMINTGIYAVSPRAMELVPDGVPFDFSKDLFPLLMKQGLEIRALPMDGYWCDLGTPRSYHQCSLDALDGRLKLAASQPEPAAVPQQQAAPASGIRRELPCRDRARLMRFIAQSLTEFGADFSDGVSLDTYGGRVRISPSPEKESIFIDVKSGDPEISASIASQMESFVRDLGQNA